MKRIISYLFCLCLPVMVSWIPVTACSVFNASRIDKVFAATNKDWNNPDTRICFIAATEGKYGRVYFGYQIPEGFQNVGGMNDRGLWYDGASLPGRSDVYNHFNKPTVQGELCEKVLEECATVEEVIRMYEHYYTPHWQGHSMWADRFGNSVIIEYGEKDVVFIQKEHEIQVMTNFYLSDPKNMRWYNCYRFNAITDILEEPGELTVGVMTRALDAAHKEGLTPTLFSNVYDLKNGEIYIYHFHQYEEVVRLNLAEQFSKGDQYLVLPQLFHGIKLKSPVAAQVVDGSKVVFNWSGSAAGYELYCSMNKDFTECEPVQAMNLYQATSFNQNELHTPGLSSVLIILLLAGATGMAKSKSMSSLLFGLMLLGSCSGCSRIFISPEFPPSIDAEAIIKDLNPGTKYYWKVVAPGENGINSQSMVKTFTTLE